MSIKDSYNQIRDQIERTCSRIGRNSSDIQLLGVCKDQPIENIIEAYECGINRLGENRVQEAELHMSQLESFDIEWHFIGKLQKNKINRILKSFHTVQSVDGVKALEHIQKRITEPRDVFIEINIADEKNKSGFTVDGLKKALNYISQLIRIRIVGLMTLPPFCDDPEDSRPFFSQMRTLQQEINEQKFDNINIRHLSMGMSHDYDIAIEEGATIIRIGTALFGRRHR